MTDTWEYKFIVGEPKLKFIAGIEKELNNLGQEGWELVNFDAVTSTQLYFILKRKIV
jgi:hypothetical protein